MKPDTQVLFAGDPSILAPPPNTADETWAELEDDLADVIGDSIDMDWTSRIGARAVVEYLKKIGAIIP